VIFLCRKFAKPTKKIPLKFGLNVMLLTSCCYGFSTIQRDKIGEKSTTA